MRKTMFIGLGGFGTRVVAKLKKYAAQLQEKCGLEVVLWDERGSSVTANRILSDAGKKRDKQRARVDAVAAQVILQSYLDFWNMQNKR